MRRKPSTHRSTQEKDNLSTHDFFHEHGEGFVRFALVENEVGIRQAVRRIKEMFFS